MILLFFMPAVFVWLTTMVIPFLYGIFISFLQWDGIGNNYEFIGLENYIKIFSTPRFMETLGRTAVYTIGTVVLSNILGIALGLLLTSALKGRNLFRTAIFVPQRHRRRGHGLYLEIHLPLRLTAVGRAWASTS